MHPLPPKPTVLGMLDLFAGIGTWAAAAAHLGVPLLGSLDIDRTALETLVKQGHKTLNTDFSQPGQWGPALATALTNPRVLGTLALTSVLIGANWLTYVLAIQAGHLFAASLGYYINPLVNVLLGTVFLGERLSRAQWVAVGPRRRRRRQS